VERGIQIISEREGREIKTYERMDDIQTEDDGCFRGRDGRFFGVADVQIRDGVFLFGDLCSFRHGEYEFRNRKRDSFGCSFGLIGFECLQNDPGKYLSSVQKPESYSRK